jgi:transcriptional regulator GlxA family with amidase domain
MYHKGSVLSSVCAGSFILANTGLLDFKKATTHWTYEPLFEKSFPNIELDCNAMIVDEMVRSGSRIITAGGMSAYVDLALYFIEKYLSKQSANQCANLLLVERGRDSQRSYKNLATTLFIEDKAISSLLLWIKKNLHKNISTQDLAKKMNLQERSFLRQFKKVVQITPNKYLQNIRIEEAKSLLINSSKNFEEITSDVGFYNESSFRRLFKKETALTPGEYRKKFQYV